MTNREESNAAEHETFPGPGPLKTDEAKRAIRPVEQMVDAAIERIARETEARAAKAGSASNQPGHALTLARSDAAALLALQSDSDAGGSRNSQLALGTERRSSGRLRWKGLDVSDEFRSYAERVARGEDLPPFTGKILAEPDPAFPWDPSAQKQAARRALRHQFGLWTGVALFLGLSIAVLVMQVRRQADGWQTPQSPLATVTLASQSQPAPPAEPAPAVELENAPAAFSETVLEPKPSPASAAAAEQPAVVQSAAPVERAVSPSTVSSAAAPRPAPVPKPAPAAAKPAGAFATTRAVEASGASTAPDVAASSAASEPTLKATGTGGTPAAASVTLGEVASTADSASALRADPKKEPSPEASAMGSLLVESPSF